LYVFIYCLNQKFVFLLHIGAHRAHIALDELKTPFKEVTIDLDTPRTKEYLAINPRGLVPSISYNGDIFTESAVVSWLLADASPGRLIAASTDKGGPQERARVNFFVDTYFTKFQSGLMKLYAAKTDEEAEPIVNEAVDKLVKELEPLLKDAKPFFGGRENIGLAEVLTGSFVIRLVSLSKAGLYPSKLSSSIAERAPNFWKWAETVAAHPSVAGIYDEERIIASTKARIAKARA
jgi:glutathione S-transferase